MQSNKSKAPVDTLSGKIPDTTNKKSKWCRIFFLCFYCYLAVVGLAFAAYFYRFLVFRWLECLPQTEFAVRIHAKLWVWSFFGGWYTLFSRFALLNIGMLILFLIALADPYKKKKRYVFLQFFLLFLAMGMSLCVMVGNTFTRYIFEDLNAPCKHNILHVSNCLFMYEDKYGRLPDTLQDLCKEGWLNQNDLICPVSGLEYQYFGKGRKTVDAAQDVRFSPHDSILLTDELKNNILLEDAALGHYALFHNVVMYNTREILLFVRDRKFLYPNLTSFCVELHSSVVPFLDGIIDKKQQTKRADR